MTQTQSGCAVMEVWEQKLRMCVCPSARAAIVGVKTSFCSFLLFLLSSSPFISLYWFVCPYVFNFWGLMGTSSDVLLRIKWVLIVPSMPVTRY